MDTDTSEREGRTLRHGNKGKRKRSVGDVVRGTIWAGAILTGAAFVTDKMATQSTGPTAYSRREQVKSVSGGRLAEQMDTPGWNLPPDTDAIVVVYPQKLSRPNGPNAAFTASAHVAAVLGLKSDEDHDNVLEVIRISISPEKQTIYATEAKKTGFRGPGILFDLERESIVFNSRDLRGLLKKWDTGKLRDSAQGEKEKVFAAVMNDIVKNLVPTGAPPRYRAIPSANPRLQRVFPGDFPRISPERFEKALDQCESMSSNEVSSLLSPFQCEAASVP